MSLVLVVAIFYYLLRGIDLALVWAQIRAMSWTEDAVLALIAAWNLATYAFVWMAVTPGLSFGRAMVMTQAVVFAFARLATILPVTPGGAGVVELVLIGGLTAAGGDRQQVTAAVLVYRALTWALPILVGIGCYLWWRRTSLGPRLAIQDHSQVNRPETASAASGDRPGPRHITAGPGPKPMSAIPATCSGSCSAPSFTFGGWRTVHDRARPGYTVQVTGATHLSFMDVFLLPLSAESPVRPMLAATRIEPRRMWRVTCDMLLAFFATHLQQAVAPPLLVGPSDDYPELTFGGALSRPTTGSAKQQLRRPARTSGG